MSLYYNNIYEMHLFIEKRCVCVCVVVAYRIEGCDKNEAQI